MLAIPPIDITDAILTANSVAETVPAYSATTVYRVDDEVRSDSDHRIYRSVEGVAATVTMPIASPGVVNKTAHGFANGTPVAFSTTGALPTGVTAGTVYYIVGATADAFNIAAAAGGTAINFTGSQSGTHTATFNPNKGYALTDATKWVNMRPTNPWAAFDIYRETATTATDEIEWTFTLPNRVNSLSLLGLDGVTEVIVVAVHDGEEVYNQTFNLNSSESITGWWSYFFGERTTANELFVTDLPPFQNMTLTVTLTGSGTISVGTASIGTSIWMGDAQYGAEISIIDYGYKKIYPDGTYEYIVGGFSQQDQYSVFIPKPQTTKIVNQFKELRGKPVVWIGHSDYGCTYNFGPYTDFRLTIPFPNHSVYSFRVEGLI